MPLVGVKAYGWEWANHYGWGMVEAAARMASQGVDLALVQNLIDPLPGSAVAQIPPKSAYDDAAWVDALRQHGVRVYQSTAVTFCPETFRRDPKARPVDQHGRQFKPFTWYYGICPTSPSYLESKLERFAEAVAATQPDGVFLSFLRFPAFWELWLPGTRRADIPEYCFCERCLEVFSGETGLALPAGGSQDKIRVLTHELRREWTAWKCRWVGALARRLRRAAAEAHPGCDVICNASGLGGSDFGNAVEEVLGQRFADLDPAIDCYELMFYFQIQKRDPAAWIPARLADARSQTQRPLLACLQAQAEYLEDVYAAGRRRRDISPEEWRTALAAAARAGTDGVLVYSWKDLLNDQAAGGSRVAELRRYRQGELR
ncbi:MAG: hypothetical protein LBE08_01260 [Bifidobacteriaceae bacterium]|jgi:hypothetical protein|nr:hypothetical protein [Bifidobacteriaceae bacterium]